MISFSLHSSSDWRATAIVFGGSKKPSNPHVLCMCCSSVVPGEKEVEENKMQIISTGRWELGGKKTDFLHLPHKITSLNGR